VTRCNMTFISTSIIKFCSTYFAFEKTVFYCVVSCTSLLLPSTLLTILAHAFTRIPHDIRFSFRSDMCFDPICLCLDAIYSRSSFSPVGLVCSLLLPVNASSFLRHFDHTHCDLTFLLSNSKYNTANNAIGCTKTPNPVHCNLRPDNVKEILSLIL
jgi:hypothetical protein